MTVGGVGLTAVDADTLAALKPLTGMKSCALITRYYRLKERIAGEMRVYAVLIAVNVDLMTASEVLLCF